MFEPFVTTKDAGKGTGLGLSLTIDILTRHGGSINVESVPGEFAEMRIRLPRIPERCATAAQTADARASPATPDLRLNSLVRRGTKRRNMVAGKLIYSIGCRQPPPDPVHEPFLETFSRHGFPKRRAGMRYGHPAR